MGLGGNGGILATLCHCSDFRQRGSIALSQEYVVSEALEQTVKTGLLCWHENGDFWKLNKKRQAA
jgi:hypothetical protein